MDHQLAIQDNGFTILKDVFDQPTIERLLASTAAGLSAGTTENIKTSLGETYAARNLIKHVFQNRKAVVLDGELMVHGGWAI